MSGAAWPADRPTPLVAAAVLAGAAVSGFVGGGVLGSLSALDHDEGPVPAVADAAPPEPVALELAVVAASCEAEPAIDTAGNAVDYRPGYAVDGDAQTAWRCAGDGLGETLELEFDRRASVVEVGLVPGYTKSDPHDGTEWYPLNRRLTEVRWHFDDGTTFEQELDPDPGRRDLQMLALPEPVDTASVTVEILASVLGDTGDRSLVAVSDVRVLALP